MSGYYLRCRGCGARRVGKTHPDQYLRPPRCEKCGRHRGQLRKGSKVVRLKDPWKIDQHMTKRDTRAAGCGCAGYNFGGIWHRRGSLHCWFNSDGSPREVEEAL